MIVYDLQCHAGAHRFEGWFKSSDDFARQCERGLVTCPHCGSGEVGKALQAPRLARKGNQRSESRTPSREQAPPEQREATPPSAPQPRASAGKSAVAGGALPPEAIEAFTRLARAQAEALKSSRNVGKDFVETARAMHYGEREAEAIHGEASLRDAHELIEEGVSVVPLPFAATTPDKAN